MIGLSRLTTVTASPPLYRLARLALSRFYSGCASAAAQPQSDYYYGAESERLAAAAAMADSEGSVPNRGVQWVFIGSPGAKRHVYAVRLAKLLEVPHISMASLVRQDLSPRSSLYKQVSAFLLSLCFFVYLFLKLFSVFLLCGLVL
jgi:adenylate kinase